MDLLGAELAPDSEHALGSSDEVTVAEGPVCVHLGTGDAAPGAVLARVVTLAAGGYFT